MESDLPKNLFMIKSIPDSKNSKSGHIVIYAVNDIDLNSKLKKDKKRSIKRRSIKRTVRKSSKKVKRSIKRKSTKK